MKINGLTVCGSPFSYRLSVRARLFFEGIGNPFYLFFFKSKHNVLILCYGISQVLSLLRLSNNRPLYVYVTFCSFTQPSMHIFAVVNSAAVNLGVPMSLPDSAAALWGEYPEMELLDPMVIQFLILDTPPHCLLFTVPFYISTNYA